MIESVTFKTRIHLLEMLMNVNYLLIPSSIVKKLGGVSKSRLKCTVNNTLTFQCGMVTLGEGQAYITLNKKRMKELAVNTGDVVDILLVKDDSKYGMEMPVELAELLIQDPESDRRFHKLTPGKQRNIIYYVSALKSSQGRINRAVKLIGNLVNCPEGKENMRIILGVE
jgi:bacteriocin resistance YdeI/OmpD-like protein/uncharacterized protein DUF1905